ncbi:MAG: DEAD/DEAH box helicase [Geminicoccaceae bacterium]
MDHPERQTADPPGTTVDPPLGQLALWLAAWCGDGQTVVYVARNLARARAMAAAVAALAPEAESLLFPPWDCLPYDRAQPSASAMGQRMAALQRLAEPRPGRLLTTTVAALAQRVPPAATLADAVWTITVGQVLQRDQLVGFLTRGGYVIDERVDEPGEAALRAGVIDLFPAAAAHPARVELDEDRVSSIRTYDPLSQRSLGEIDSLELGPACEVLNGDDRPQAHDLHALPLYYDELSTLLDYLPQGRLVLDPGTMARFEALTEQVVDAYEARQALRRSEAASGMARPLVEPARLYLDRTEFEPLLASRDVLQLDPPSPAKTAPEPGTRRDFLALVRRELAEGRRVVVAASEPESWRQLVATRLATEPALLPSWHDLPGQPPGSVGLLDAPLPSGFRDGDQVVLVAPALTEPPGTRRAKTPASELPVDDMLRPGDRVVHAERGIAELVGLETVEADAVALEHVALRFAGDRRLLIDSDELDRVWRYGSADADVALDRVDGEAWRARRDEVAAEVETAAADLARLARQRAIATGPSLGATPGYARFIRRFPYEPSDGQAQAIEATLADLERGSPPMDRLVCGDVGFGKTEVALRAAAVAALNGRQVAVLAPTTLLVRQHLETFRRRFAGFDVRIEQLSRLGRDKYLREVRQGLADGSVRIVIGTHALASPQLQLRNLGLVIIDEEQRFGTAQKAALTRLRQGVHVLTLTATPIPRTLQAALAAIQDLSVIATPPQRRLPIRTFILPFDPAVVREALLRERRRRGRSFVVVPRIADLAPMRERLAGIVADFDIVTAHGRMRADELDRVMLNFASGEHDVLLTTAIIETGLDIPGADTMLVWRPERFGIAQLHQLRGRVGRGRERAACYLLHDQGQELPEPVTRRLRTLETFESLGAGFAISARDLDLRGAGTLGGEAQVGHVQRIGSGLYRHLLSRALRRARGEAIPEEWSPELALGVPASIPEEYVPEPEIRLELYTRLARVRDAEELDGLVEEISDRFGTPPALVANLMRLAGLRLRCRELGVTRLEIGPKAAAATLHGELASDLPEYARWSDGRLILDRSSAGVDQRLEHATMLLDLIETATRAQPKKSENASSTSSGRSSGR